MAVATGTGTVTRILKSITSSPLVNRVIGHFMSFSFTCSDPYL